MMTRANRSLLALVVVLLVGCSAGTPDIDPPLAPGRQPQPPSPPNSYVFYTTEAKISDRFVFAFRNGELFVQAFTKSDGGDEAVRRLYHRITVTPEFKKLIESWFDRQQTETRMLHTGEIKKNGPAILIRHAVGYDKSRGHSWSGFIDDESTQAFLRAVREAVTAEFEVEHPPDWINEDDRVRNDFEGAVEGIAR